MGCDLLETRKARGSSLEFVSLVSALLLGTLCLRGFLPNKASPLLQDKLLGETPLSLKGMTVHHSLEAKVPFIIAFFSKKMRHLVQIHSGKPTSKQMGSLRHLLRAVTAEQGLVTPNSPQGWAAPALRASPGGAMPPEPAAPQMTAEASIN